MYLELQALNIMDIGSVCELYVDLIFLSLQKFNKQAQVRNNKFLISHLHLSRRTPL